MVFDTCSGKALVYEIDSCKVKGKLVFCLLHPFINMYKNCPIYKHPTNYLKKLIEFQLDLETHMDLFPGEGAADMLL